MQKVKLKMKNYQLDFFTPGISPRLANSRKQIRHRAKSRMKARFLPQRQHRRTIREENFGLRLDFASWAFVDIIILS